jgi:toxin secretion/phage lysis holin
MIKTKMLMLCSVLGSACSVMFGGWDEALKLLVCLMCADYLTGLTVAVVFKKSPKTESGSAESKVGFKGLCRKGVILCVVLISYRLELATGINCIREAVIYGFSANEIISLTENAGLMGLPIPKVICNAIDILKQRSGENDDT